jgi:hypothetical protein
MNEELIDMAQKFKTEPDKQTSI